MKKDRTVSRLHAFEPSAKPPLRLFRKKSFVTNEMTGLIIAAMASGVVAGLLALPVTLPRASLAATSVGPVGPNAETTLSAEMPAAST